MLLWLIVGFEAKHYPFYWNNALTKTTTPYKKICWPKNYAPSSIVKRCLAFNGSSTHRGGGAGIMLWAPSDTNLHYLLSSSPNWNNEIEYEALVIGLFLPYNWELKAMCPERFLAYIKQFSGEFALSRMALLT